MSAPPPSADPAAPVSPKKKGEAKTGVVFKKFPVEVISVRETRAPLRKPDWIRVKAGSPTTRFYEIKNILREHRLHTVCEEASCPNIGECFGWCPISAAGSTAHWKSSKPRHPT